MIDLGTRVIDDQGNVVYHPEALFQIIASGRTLPKHLICTDSTELDRLNKSCQEMFEPDTCVLELEPVDLELRKNAWLIPDEYLDLDILSILESKCSSDVELNRVRQEYELFDKAGMVPLLKTCVYLVDKFKENNVLYGVGRGSSCSSFILYLLDVNLVNPVEFDIPITEFFREGVLNG